MIARALTLIVVAMLADRARAEPDVSPVARRFSDQGRALHELGDYDEAIVAYKQAYLISPSPGILFNMAQAYRLAGDCANAAMLYRRFLEKSEDPSASRIARRQLAAVEPCASKAEAAAADDRQALARRAPIAVVAAPSAPGHGHAALYVAGASALALGVGAYFAVDARDAGDQVAAGYARGEKWSQIAPIDARGQQSSELAIGSFVIGGAALATAAILYWRERHDADSRRPIVMAAPTSRGAALGVTWRW